MPFTMKFNGREFKYYATYASLDEARGIASIFRGEGFYTRIFTTTEGWYSLWIRVKEEGHDKLAKRS